MRTSASRWSRSQRHLRPWPSPRIRSASGQRPLRSMPPSRTASTGHGSTGATRCSRSPTARLRSHSNRWHTGTHWASLRCSPRSSSPFGSTWHAPECRLQFVNASRSGSGSCGVRLFHLQPRSPLRSGRRCCARASGRCRGHQGSHCPRAATGLVAAAQPHRDASIRGAGKRRRRRRSTDVNGHLPRSRRTRADTRGELRFPTGSGVAGARSRGTVRGAERGCGGEGAD
mmetsp:Transcript_103806/g.289120  ORF Transcript_103806/g.289120 Transcript_103806/m.289120 type:complete len:229 (+) Transcript_103806:1131-1817(+)